MTHNEERAHWFKEGVIGLAVGVLYGTTNVIVGHPFDTMKTKMQAQAGYDNIGMVKCMMKTMTEQRLIGFYRGCIPLLMGSGVYRSAQFSVFEGVYTYLNKPLAKSEIPGTGGLQLRVLAGGAVASTVRAIIECPLEYAKVKRQTQQTWKVRESYTGFGVMWFRTVGLMCTYFILIDSARRNFPEEFKKPLLGPFLASGVAATMAWWLVWPLENMKNQVQSGYSQGMPVMRRILMILREKGVRSLYRGILPGSIRSFLANGVSMIVMQFAQKKVTQYGLR